MPGSFNYQIMNPEMLTLKDTLEQLEITHKQLIALAILIGTDYNYGGIKGIGPKKGLKLIKKHGENFEELFKEAKWRENFDFDWKKIFDVFSNMPVTDDYKVTFENPDKEKLREILVTRHQFSEERVKNTLEKLEKAKKLNEQKGLGDFF